MLEVHPVGGRFPGPLAPRFDQTTIIACIEAQGDTVTIRMDDSRPEHSDFWMKISITTEPLLSEIRQNTTNQS